MCSLSINFSYITLLKIMKKVLYWSTEGAFQFKFNNYFQKNLSKRIWNTVSGQNSIMQKSAIANYWKIVLPLIRKMVTLWILALFTNSTLTIVCDLYGRKNMVKVDLVVRLIFLICIFEVSIFIIFTNT